MAFETNGEGSHYGGCKPQTPSQGGVTKKYKGLEANMCGIMGMVLNRRVRTEGELDDLRRRFADLLVATQVRGRDAAGAFIVNTSGVTYHRAAGPASKLVKSPYFGALLDKVSEDTTAVIGHTRFATTGCPSCNENNHPINIKAIVGVHNGVVSNDEEIRRMYPYTQEVDSAAIFSLIASATEKEPLSGDLIGDILPSIRGDLAIAVADARQTDKLFIARDSSRPLWTAPDVQDDVMWLASTKEIIERGLTTEDGDHYGMDLDARPLPAYSVTTITSALNDDTKMTIESWK